MAAEEMFPLQMHRPVGSITISGTPSSGTPHIPTHVRHIFHKAAAFLFLANHRPSLWLLYITVYKTSRSTSIPTIPLTSLSSSGFDSAGYRMQSALSCRTAVSRSYGRPHSQSTHEVAHAHAVRRGRGVRGIVLPATPTTRGALSCHAAPAAEWVDGTLCCWIARGRSTQGMGVGALLQAAATRAGHCVHSVEGRPLRRVVRTTRRRCARHSDLVRSPHECASISVAPCPIARTLGPWAHIECLGPKKAPALLYMVRPPMHMHKCLQPCRYPPSSPHALAVPGPK